MAGITLALTTLVSLTVVLPLPAPLGATLPANAAGEPEPSCILTPGQIEKGVQCKNDDLDSFRKVPVRGVTNLGLSTFSNYLMGLVGGLAVLYLIYGGVRYIMSGESIDEKAVAKRTITYSVVGLVTTTLAYVIVSQVVKTTSSIEPPPTQLFQSFSCTGSDPEYATLCEHGDIGLTVDTPKHLVASCDETKCAYACSEGYMLQGTLCVPQTYICTGSTPPNTRFCAGSATGLVADTAKSLVTSCGTTKCAYTCSAGYEVQGGTCVPQVYNCTGPTPAYASPCAGSTTGLTANTLKRIVASCGTTKCAYTCSAGYSFTGSVCKRVVGCAPQGTCRRDGTGCPAGTECSGHPAYGCYPPGCETPICLSGGTQLLAEDGPVSVRDLTVGDRIWTVDAAGATVLAPILRTSRTPVPPTHQLVHLVLADGRRVDASPGHPTVDGRRIGDLRVGDPLDGSTVASASRLPVDGDSTYDVLPAGGTGRYVADGIWLGSTLRP